MHDIFNLITTHIAGCYRGGGHNTDIFREKKKITNTMYALIHLHIYHHMLYYDLTYLKHDY